MLSRAEKYDDAVGLAYIVFTFSIMQESLCILHTQVVSQLLNVCEYEASELRFYVFRFITENDI